MAEIKVKRIYEPYDISDGYRILVDRLWPRGIKKEEAEVNVWYKNIAPSNELRKWYHQQPERFEEFRKKYMEELETDEEKTQMIKKIGLLAMTENITLLYSSKNILQNNAVVLKEEIIKTIGKY